VNSQSSTGHLSDDAALLFRRILRGMPGTLDQHASDLGWSRTRAGRRVDDLLGLRLVRTDGEGRLRADDPRATLGRLLDTEETTLDARRQELLDLRQSIDSFEIDYRRGLQLSGPRVPPWEEIPRAEAPAVVEQLARSSRGPVLQASARIGVGPGHHEDVQRRRAVLIAEGREQRTIFPLLVLTDPQWHSFAEARAATGEAQRYLEDVPVEFAVFGRSGVLLDEGGGEESDYLLIRPRAVVDVFVILFESLWHRADPLNEGRADQRDVKLLELLAVGFKDEAIARHLGLSLRTVRWRLAGLMAEHGADTRFQLGLAVARRGLLDDQDRSPAR
jgi:DNA-binding NarL/FixJ family response regulator